MPFHNISNHSSPPAGTPPEQIIPVLAAHPTQIRLMLYSPNDVQVIQDATVEQVERALNRWSVVWVDVGGLGHPDILQNLSTLLGIHPLILAAVTRREHVMDVRANQPTIALSFPCGTECLSIFTSKNVVLSIHANSCSEVDALIEKVKVADEPLRVNNAGYLVARLVNEGYHYLNTMAGTLGFETDSSSSLMEAEHHASATLMDIQHLQKAVTTMGVHPLFGNETVAMVLSQVSTNLDFLYHKLLTLQGDIQNTLRIQQMKHLKALYQLIMRMGMALGFLLVILIIVSII